MEVKAKIGDVLKIGRRKYEISVKACSNGYREWFVPNLVRFRRKK